MKLFKSLLLGSAAGLVAVSGASAADLGIKKPAAAVEYVRVCSAHGAGFWYIPGSDVCIKIGGRVRAEYLATKSWVRGGDVSSFRANGRLEADLRQTTDFGLLRAFIRYDVYADGGRYAGHNAAYAGANQISGAVQPNNQGNFLDKAFIQFYTGSAGFFTAGRSVSFFDFYANNDNWTRLPGSDRGTSNLFAYTFTFGGGLTATLSVEDAYERRRNGIGAVVAINPLTGASYVVTAANSGTFTYGGQRMPDVVGNVRIDQSWGSAQLSGAIHQIYAGSTATSGLVNFPSTKYGWAIQGGVKLNLPMLAAGDTLWLQAAYSKGASDFAGVTRYTADNAAFGILTRVIAGADAYVVTNANGSTTLRQATSWSVVGSFVHNFTPTIQGALFGGYGVVNYSGSSAVNGFNDYKAYAVGGQLSWLPVRNFRIGTEVVWNRIDPNGRVILPTVPVNQVKGSYSSWTGRLRFQRDF